MEPKTVALFVIDGMRPDGLLQADAPFLHGLMARGSACMHATTVMPSYTLPCHISLFCGVEPGRHGILSNTWVPQARPVPDLFQVTHQAGLGTASFYNWEELRDLSRPGALDVAVMLNNNEVPHGAGDTALAELAADWLRCHPPQMIFVYLGYVDVAGHACGWMSDPYLQGIANASACVQTICQALPVDATVLVTADHGGHERSHGSDLPEDMTIPLIIAGPNVPAGGRWTTVSILDLAPTIAGRFGVTCPAEWAGRDLLTPEYRPS